MLIRLVPERFLPEHLDDRIITMKIPIPLPRAAYIGTLVSRTRATR